MMEYTMARVAMIICGALLLAAVVPPVTSLYDDGESSGMQHQSESVCRMLDSFHDSEADEMTICLNTVLPQDCSVIMDGYFVIIIDGENEYRYNTGYIIDPDRGSYSGNDYVRITKNGDSLMIESL